MYIVYTPHLFQSESATDSTVSVNYKPIKVAVFIKMSVSRSIIEV